MVAFRGTHQILPETFDANWYAHAPNEPRDESWATRIKMTERYAKLAKQHIARTSNTAREMWKLREPSGEKEAVG